MVSGTVKFFNRTKRFGFIAGDDGKDYFVHATGLMPDVTIAEGDKVSFEVVEGEKGPKADRAATIKAIFRVFKAIHCNSNIVQLIHTFV